MKTILRSLMRPEKARSVVFTMALVLMLSSLVAPVMPLVDAATVDNFSSAEAAAKANNQIVPLDQDSDTPPDGGEQPPPGENPPTDTDMDGILDEEDSCPDLPNLGTDWNADGIDDACDPQSNDVGDQADPNQQLPSQISINLHWCPLNVDLSQPQSTSDPLKAQCNRGGPRTTATVYMEVSGLTLEHDFVGYDQTPVGHSFTDIPFGMAYLDFASVSNFNGEALFCEAYYFGGSNTKPYGATFRSQTSTPGYPINVLGNEDITCDWFGGLPTTHTLNVTKLYCDETSDLADVQTFQDVTTNCVGIQDPASVPASTINVEVRQGEGDFPYNQNGEIRHQQDALFGNVASGSMRVTEQPMEGFQLEAVFCSLVDWDNPSNSFDFQKQTFDDTSMWMMKSSAATFGHCQVYNQQAGADLGPESEDDIRPARVSVTKFQCDEMLPEGEDAYSWYTTNCTTHQDGVTFGLIRELVGPVNSAPTVDGVAGIYDNFPEADNYFITESSPPTGFEPVAAFCRFASESGPSGEYQPYEIVENSISVTFDGSSGIDCLWFNYAGMIIMEAPSNLTIYKWICPAGYDYSAQDADPMVDCDTPAPDGITFTVSDTDPNTADIQTDTGDQMPGNGYVYFGGLGPGMLSITETQPAGYESAFLWNCDAYQNEVAEPISAGWVYEMDVPSGAEITCHWMNVPGEDEGTSLTIYKWECPPTVTDHLLLHEYYETECATEQPGVEFTVTDDNGPRTVYSDTNGVQVDGLIGLINISEVIPDGYGVPAVFCQALNDETSTSAQLGGGNVTLPPLADDSYQCWFYNIPLDDFSLTLYKWQCPQGTMYGQTHNYYSAECDMEHPGVPFQITSNNGTVDFMSDTNGYQVDNLLGQVILREMGLPGYGDPVVYCQLLNDNDSTLYTSTNGIVMLPPAMGDDYQCFWYNIPEPDSTVTINKWRCPDGMPAEYSQSWFEMNCKSTPMEVDFTLTDSKGPRMLTSTGGMAQWTDVSTGAVQITEHIPPGYSMQPFLVCYVIDPAGMASATFTPVTVNGTWHTTITAAGSEIVCDWYNWYLGNGEITVYKWLCPDGYNRNAWGADPMTDCTQAAQNGAFRFKLDQPDPGVDLFSDTGDSIPGGVYFGGLTPGDYTLSEIILEGNYIDVFVWECYGLNMSAVHPKPLSVGLDLPFTITGGDEIVCHWFNVPVPQHGWMVVHKFNCSTEKYVSDVYCYTNQTGQYFDLQMWNGSTWTTVQSGTTDVSGKVTFTSLNPGDYRLIEPNKQACLMKSSNITPGGNLGVNMGEETIVHVYNCQTPPPPQKTPTKYPNTGVAPTAESDAVRTPAVELAGLAGLLGLAMNRRRVVAGAGLVTAGAAATALPLLNAQELQPLDSTPAPGTPAPEDFWCATPTASTPDALIEPDAEGTPTYDPCNRGAIPIQMRIPIIEVDAPMEYLEIIDGLMQQPTGDTHITWYKETSRLGEVGNGIYAAHVNWYGNPEGIFFRLESLQEGDVIEIDGDNQQTYLFEVQWMQDFPSDEEPPDEALGLTDEVAITLITCGGEWSSALSEYDHRTLVRAVLRE